jgi:hypothetical protein
VRIAYLGIAYQQATVGAIPILGAILTQRSIRGRVVALAVTGVIRPISAIFLIVWEALAHVRPYRLCRLFLGCRLDNHIKDGAIVAV